VLGVKELVKLAETDKNADRMFSIFGNNLGSFLVPWINKFDADCIVLGGNISKSFSLFEKELNEQFKLNNIEIPVFKSALDEDAALIGSAKLCDNEFYSNFIQQ
ncbi:MAG: ROK family protein, partial [Draconibacterium sp.]|nr:ROK family protein [Draconibacterium sp.]